MKQLVIGMAVAVVVVLGAYLLVRPTNAPQTTPALEEIGSEKEATSEPEVSPASPSAAPSVFEEEKSGTGSSLNASLTINVNMTNLDFNPSQITIQAGKTYKLNLSGRGTHTFTVDELGIDFSVPSGQSRTFDLRVDKKGTYDIYCSTPGHKEAGMVGKLIVN